MGGGLRWLSAMVGTSAPVGRGVGVRHGFAGPVRRVLRKVRLQDLADVVLVPEAFTSQFSAQDGCLGLVRQLEPTIRARKRPRAWTRDKAVRHATMLARWSGRRYERRRRRVAARDPGEPVPDPVRRALRTAGPGHRGGEAPVPGGRGVPCHGVRVCPHCRTYWQRDVNAARNIRHIYLIALSNNGALPGWQAAKIVQGWTGRPVG